MSSDRIQGTDGIRRPVALALAAGITTGAAIAWVDWQRSLMIRINSCYTTHTRVARLLNLKLT